jgi:hypothetical protein
MLLAAPSLPAPAAVHLIEAESTTVTAGWAEPAAAAGASGDAVLLWPHGTTRGGALTLAFALPPAAEPGAYHVYVRLAKGPDTAIVRLAVNGSDAGWPIDLYALQPQITPPIDLGVHTLHATGNLLGVVVVDANAKTTQAVRFALDTIELVAPDSPPPGDWLVSAGPFRRIYDPSIGEQEPWYINDHSIIRGPDGAWHLFGITRQEPPNWMEEQSFAHATAPALTAAPWRKQPYALTADYAEHGEVHLWAPHVIEHAGTYYMYYCAGAGTAPTRTEVTRQNRDSQNYRTHLATSTDLRTWVRHPANPMFTDGWDARDPMVLRLPEDAPGTGPDGQPLAGKWILYYTATDPVDGGNHVVACRVSDDLVNWSDRAIAYRDPTIGRGGGTTESPFVVHRGDWYYLFIAPRGGPGNGYAYAGTDVFRSRDPLQFASEDIVGHIPAHAGEVVRDTDGTWYITHCGWGQGGVYLAPLRWHD